MEFLPWRTVDLDGAFRVTAPESIAEVVIQEVSHAVTFRFSGELNQVRLEILLTPPWGWEDCFPAEEREQPPARFVCRLISRSTGRRTVVQLEDDGMGLWFAETNFTALLDGEEIRAEALLVRSEAAVKPCGGFAHQKGQIVGRVSDCMLAGNAFDVFNRIRSIGSEQEVHGSLVSPAVCLDAMSVSRGG